MVEYQDKALNRCYAIFENLMYALIGSDVRIRSLEPDILLYGFICLLISLVLRILATWIFTFGIGCTFKERLFIAIAWLPKATVQAAIGSVPLDHASTDEEIYWARIVLTVAVLSILLTGPLGGMAIQLSANKLLVPDDKNDKMDPENLVTVEQMRHSALSMIERASKEFDNDDADVSSKVSIQNVPIEVEEEASANNTKL